MAVEPYKFAGLRILSWVAYLKNLDKRFLHLKFNIILFDRMSIPYFEMN